MAQSTVYSDIVAPSCEETVQPGRKLSFLQPLVSTVLKITHAPSTIIVINKKLMIISISRIISVSIYFYARIDASLSQLYCQNIMRVIEIIFFDGRT